MLSLYHKETYIVNIVYTYFLRIRTKTTIHTRTTTANTMEIIRIMSCVSNRMFDEGGLIDVPFIVNEVDGVGLIE